jgi:hypothetical protein
MGGLNKKVADSQEKVENLTKEVVAAKKEIENSAEAQKVEVAKIKEAAEQLHKQHVNLIKRESDLNETINVLHRLKNIAQDELSGTSKISTQMTGINVVSNHGVSFIQKSNLKEELKTIMKKSDTAAKSLISTLILMAANDDGHYSDPKIVAKIMAILDKIIASNVQKLKQLSSDFLAEKKNYTDIIENAANMVMNLQEGSIKDSFHVELYNKEISMFNNDIVFFQKALKRRADRSAFTEKYCKKQAEMAEVYAKRYSAVVLRVNELKSELGQA